MSSAPRETVAGRLCIVLEVLVRAPAPVPFPALQLATGFERRALYRYLAALESSGLIERGPRGSTLGDRLRARQIDVEVSA